MVIREFASWVAPIAERDRAARAELLRFVRSVSDDFWRDERPLDGWTRRQLLGHLAGDTGKWFAHLLDAVLAGETPDPSHIDVHATNARDVRERKGHTVRDLIAEIDNDGAQHDEMLAQLTEGHATSVVAPYGKSLQSFLSENPAGNRAQHDLTHLAQLRASTCSSAFNAS